MLVLRDQDSVEELSAKLRHARKVVLVGNGGIAMELACALQGIEVPIDFRSHLAGLRCRDKQNCWPHPKAAPIRLEAKSLESITDLCLFGEVHFKA